MSALIYELFCSTTLSTLGIYHLTTTTLTFLRSPTTFSSKPLHPLSSSTRRHLRLLPLYLISLSLLISSLYHLLSSASPDPLLKGHSPVHSFTSLQSASVSFLFFLLSLSLFFPPLSFLPDDLIFALASVSFYLLSSSSSSRAAVQTSDLESHLLSISSRISLASSLLSLLLAISPRLFLADVALSSTVVLQGLWALQTGLSLYVDAFIPDGCHKLLDVVGGVEGSTKCELDESKLRAVSLLDLMFVVYVIVVVMVVFAVYAGVSKAIGVSRRLGSYEALPNVVAADGNHVQLKTLSGTQA